MPTGRVLDSDPATAQPLKTMAKKKKASVEDARIEGSQYYRDYCGLCGDAIRVTYDALLAGNPRCEMCDSRNRSAPRPGNGMGKVWATDEDFEGSWSHVVRCYEDG